MSEPRPRPASPITLHPHPPQGPGVLCRALLGNLLDAGVALEQCLGRVGCPLLPAQRAEARHLLETIQESMRDLPAQDRAAIAEIDWLAWAAVACPAGCASRQWREHLAAQLGDLLPATLSAVRNRLQGG
ncbi:hypothetical protein [Zoogloea sp.]|uniref:hypothetical protein n=1 Tax=Zoogloea sp. TaxID=49181 RepID=UPI0035B33A45